MKKNDKPKKNVTHQDIADKQYNYILILPHPYIEVYNHDEVDNHNISIYHISHIDILYAQLVANAVGEFQISLFDPIMARTYGIKRIIRVDDSGQLWNGNDLMNMKLFQELINKS